MQSSVQIHTVKQELSAREWAGLSIAGKDDICFFRFNGGNSSETDKLSEQLNRVKGTGILLIGIFRFPFRFEGKKRLQTAIKQYHLMKQLCDAVIYLHSDGIMQTLQPGTSVQEANFVIDRLEAAPIHAIEHTIRVPGEMNIDVHDIQAFIRGVKGPLYVRTFEGDAFDEPLKYLIATPYLPQDFADGEQMIINIGYTQQVDMAAFQQINLRLNDLLHKAELFKLGTYLLNDSSYKFQITLLIKGIADPYPAPAETAAQVAQPQWFKRKWSEINTIIISKYQRKRAFEPKVIVLDDGALL